MEKGVKPDVQEKHNGTPLMWASQKGCKGIVQLLLKFGADVTLTDNDKKTALMLELGYNHPEIAELLRSH